MGCKNSLRHAAVNCSEAGKVLAIGKFCGMKHQH